VPIGNKLVNDFGEQPTLNENEVFDVKVFLSKPNILQDVYSIFIAKTFNIERYIERE